MLDELLELLFDLFDALKGQNILYSNCKSSNEAKVLENQNVPWVALTKHTLKEYPRRKLDKQSYAQTLKSIPEHRYEIFIK